MASKHLHFTNGTETHCVPRSQAVHYPEPEWTLVAETSRAPADDEELDHEHPGRFRVRHENRSDRERLHKSRDCLAVLERIEKLEAAVAALQKKKEN